MSTAVRLITAEELLAMAISQRHELIKGEVRLMAPAGFEHGVIIIKLSRLLANFVDEEKLGLVVGAETGYTLERGPDTVRGADVSFVAAARIPAGRLTRKFWEGAPDLAVEVLSPDDTARDVNKKVDEYLNAGARLVWVVSPDLRNVTTHAPSRDPQVLKDLDVLSGEDVLPGFRCAVADIFV